ncbi:hypothetical protein K9L97_03665 [Candidatus Woesearchaeota archaeon]|nr:hypothetical protein [Candidatus Woesearchaeota archaeon]
MDISNRALAMFLLAAIVVSLGGTIVSLNKLDSVTTTGYATSGSGEVNLTINETLAIEVVDGLVDFFECTTGDTAIVITSDASGETTTHCSLFTGPDNITVRNSGNTDANVTIQFSDVGNGTTSSGGFLATENAESEIAYKISNAGDATYGAGCSGNSQSTFVNATQAATELLACENLTTGVDTSMFTTDFQIIVPSNAPQTTHSVTVTYTATAAGN